jgi:hypothetical protein
MKMDGVHLCVRDSAPVCVCVCRCVGVNVCVCEERARVRACARARELAIIMVCDGDMMRVLNGTLLGLPNGQDSRARCSTHTERHPAGRAAPRASSFVARQCAARLCQQHALRPCESLAVSMHAD